jgi:hypothetical protein
MEPVGGLAFGERIGLALTESQVALGDSLAATAAFRPSARSRLDHVGHSS